MSNPIIANLKKLVGGPRDGELLRYSLGNEYFKEGDFATAVSHLREAIRLNPRHSAAWKLLGKALTEAGDMAAAVEAYRQGIVVAEARGDVQSAKEMQVFAKRLKKALGENIA